MKTSPTAIAGVLLIEPKVHGDSRGYFVETYALARYQAAGVNVEFVQGNISRSRRGVLRGLHLQNPHAQGKLVRVVHGTVFDVAVDVRVGSPTFGNWVGQELSEENQHQLYVPPGCAHGFCVTSEYALFSYQCSEYYHPESELSVRYDDPTIGIQWPLMDISLSAKDRAAPLLSEIPSESLPKFQG